MAYIYRHVTSENIPFYIGIGSDKKYKRAYNKKGRSYSWKDIACKQEYKVEIILDDLTWEEACQKEKEFISLYGRKDKNQGILTNLTDGGDGQYGRKDSLETKIKKSKPKTEQARNNMKLSHNDRDYSYLKGKAGCKKGIKKSLQWCESQSQSKKGKERGTLPWLINNNERSQKISDSKKGKPSLKKTPITQYDLNNNLIKTFPSITEAAIFINKPNGIPAITECVNGKRKTAYKYIWKK